jgi:hypothetical protein
MSVYSDKKKIVGTKSIKKSRKHTGKKFYKSVSAMGKPLGFNSHQFFYLFAVLSNNEVIIIFFPSHLGTKNIICICRVVHFSFWNMLLINQAHFDALRSVF